MTRMLGPLTPKVDSVSELAYHAIVEAIVSGDIPPGGQLSEATLAGQLQVSKTPVREALLRLREVGLIDDRYLRGTRVVERTEELARLAYDVRATLESGLARLATERIDPTDARLLTDAARLSLEAARRGDVPAFQAADKHFHGLVAQIASSERLARLSENASLLTRVMRRRFAPTQGDATACGRGHVQIATAIRRRDESAAADAAFAHVRFVWSLVERELAGAHEVAPNAAVGKDAGEH